MNEDKVPSANPVAAQLFARSRFKVFKIKNITRPYAYHLILIMLLYLLFIPTDFINVSEYIGQVLPLRLFTFMLTVIAVVFFRNIAPKYFDMAEVFLLSLVYSTVLYIGYLGLQQGNFGYQNGVLVVMLVVGTVSRLNFRFSLVLMTAMLVGYFTVIFPLKYQHNPAVEQDFAMIFVASYMICLVACHRRGKEERQFFKRDKKIRNQQLALKAQHRKLATMSRTDPLTGLKNRYSLSEFEAGDTQLDEQRQSEAVGFLMIDIDNFKRINDNYGHLVGDEVIRVVAAMIKYICQRQSDLCFRYGGEEFLVILPGTHLTGLKDLAERIRLAVMDQHFANGSLSATVSIGMMMNANNLLDLETSIDHADQALYQAKTSGRNCCVVWGK